MRSTAFNTELSYISRQYQHSSIMSDYNLWKTVFRLGDCEGGLVSFEIIAYCTASIYEVVLHQIISCNSLLQIFVVGTLLIHPPQYRALR